MKKLNKKTTIAVFAALCFTSLISLFYSCEVGLGSAVDTQPPSVSISYPPSLSVIRDSFVFAGNWNDDRNIKGVFVEVYQIRDDQKTIVFKDQAETTDKIDTEEEKKDGTWFITLNNYDAENPEWYNGWEFCDGDYEVQVYAKDNAEQVSSVASRTISIDNTAPILLLTNPTSAGNDSSPATFGQIIQLTGTFYDFCGKISNLVVSFYDENGAAICDSTFSNITSMSDSSPLTIARYYSTDEERTANKDIFDNYVKLLGAEKLAKFENKENIDNAQVYFTVTAKDNAKVYKTIGDNGTGEGNSTNHFYRGTTSMQNLVSGDGGIEDFTLADFAMYLNGTSKKYSSYSSKINEIENAARGCSVTTATNNDISQNISNTDSRNGDPVYLTFVLNPKNNPLYTVGGYEKIATPVSQLDSENYSDQGFKNIYAGTPVPLNISVGADNKNLSTHTISIFKLDKTNLAKAGITKEINQANFAEIFKKENNDKYFSLLWTWNSDIYETYNEWGIDKTSCYTVTDDDANVSTISKQFVINSFEATHNYEFLVLGEDITGNNIISAITKGYGFCGKVSETAPKFSEIEGYTKNNKIVNESILKGTSVATQADVLYLEGKINTDKPLFGESGFNYTITIKDSSDDKRKEIVTNNITVQNLQEEPDYSEDLKSNYCYKTSEESPFEYTWRFTTADFADDNKVKTLITTPGSYEITLDLTASNSETSSTTYTRVYTLDNLAPEPTLSEIGVAVEKELSEARSAYWINPEEKLNISGLVTDNLSTAKACETWVELVGLSDVNTEDTTITWKSSSKTNVNKWTFEIPAEAFVANKDGVKKYGANLYIYSQDVAGNKNVPEAIPLWFDTEAPTGVHLIDSSFKDLYFRVGEQDRDDFIKTNADGSVTGTNGLTFDNDLDKNVGGKYSEGTYGNASTITLRGNYEDSGSGVAMIYYKVYQGAANDPTSRTDLEALKNEVKSQADGKFVPLAAGSEITKRVFYNDKTGNGTLSGKLSAGDVNSVEVNGVVKKYWTTVKSNFMTTISGFVTGENYLVLVAEDYVGNAAVDAQKVGETLYNNFKVNVDNAVPTVTTGDEFSKSQYYRPRTGGTFEIYGIAEDENAGIRNLVVKANGKEITKDIDTYGTITTISSGIVVEETNDQGVKVYNIYGLKEDGTVDNENLLLANISKEYYKENDTIFNTFTSNKVFWKTVLKDDIFKEDSENYIASGKSVSVQAIVTDNAGVGNTETYSIANITIDSKEPTVTIKNPKDNTEVNQTITISFVNSDGNGSGIDESAAAKPKLYYSNDAPATESSTWTALEDLTATEADGGWSFTLDTTQFTTTSKNISIKISSQDVVGNVGYSTPQVLKIDQDSDRPKVSFSTVSVTNGIDSNNKPKPMSENNYTWLRNTTTLVGTVTDDDGVEELWIGVKHSTNSTISYTKVFENQGATIVPWSLNLKDLYAGDDEEKEAFANGSQILYFKVKDTESTDYFEYTTDDSKTQVKLSDGTTTLDTSILYLKVDTMPPQTELQGIWYKAEGATTEAYNNASGFKLGGTMRTYNIKATASDANGIIDVSAKTTFGSKIVLAKTVSVYNKQKEVITVNTDGIYDGLSYVIAEFELSEADITALSDFSNSATITFTARDAASNSQSSNASFAVDYKKPVITVSGPSSTQYCSGKETAYGTVDTSAKVYFAISTGNTENEAPGKTVTSYSYTEEDGTENTGTMLSGHQPTIEDYKLIKDTSLSWYIYFDGDTEKSTGSHIITLSNYLISYWIAPHNDGSEVADDIDSSFNRFVKLYLWLYAEDEFGNISDITKYPLLVDPQGDRPRVEIIYPDASTSSLGGTVVLRGSASDPNGVVQDVWAQIKKADDIETQNFSNSGLTTNFEVTSSDIEFWLEKGYKVYYVETGNNKTPVELNSNTYNSSTHTAGNCYIKANFSGSAWNLTINKDKEFNPSPNYIKPVAYRIYSRDNDGKFSLPASQLVKFDSDNPVITNVYLKQFADNTTGTGDVVASREYTDDMWVRGTWWLTGTATDTDNITAIDIYGDTQTITAGSSVDFKYKLETGDGVGNLGNEFKIEVTDEANHTTTKPIAINFDNNAPEFIGADNSAYKLAPSVNNNNGFYNLSSVVSEAAVGSNKQSGLNYIAFYFMRRNNTLKDASVNQSETDTVYNPMLVKAYSDAATVSSSTTVIGVTSETDVVYDSGLYWLKKSITRQKDTSNVITLGETDTSIMGGGLVKLNGTTYFISSVNGKSVTIDGDPLYDSADISKTETAYFALALVVNNTISENGSGALTTAGYYSHISNNDGDGIVEEISKNGTNYTWETAINSKNIPDGPIELHYIAFDKAGNYSIGIVGHLSESEFRESTAFQTTPDRSAYEAFYSARDTDRTSNILYVDGEKSYYNKVASDITNTNYKKAAFISNNAPRLAGLIYATDSNANGTIDENEKIATYNNQYSEFESAKTSWTVDTRLITRGKTVFYPEILGGNGALYYNYMLTKDGESDAYYNNTQKLTNLTLSHSSTNDDGYDKRDYSIEFDVIDFLTPDSEGTTTGTEIVDGKQTFNFTFYDQTDATDYTNGGGQTAKLDVTMTVAVRDNTPPKNTIIPFYWKNLNSNSIFASDKTTTGSYTVTSVDKLSGHIELEADWTATDSSGTKLASGYDSTVTSGEFDADPKVSGKIKIEGIASDNKLLKELYLTIPGFNSGNAITIATYANGKWTPGALLTENGEIPSNDVTATDTTPFIPGGYAAEISQASYQELIYAGVATEAQVNSTTSNRDALVPEITQDFGHVVKWTVYFDTEKIANHVALDVQMSAGAKDLGSPSLNDIGTDIKYNTSNNSSEDTTGTTSTTYTSQYKMDIVPYITGVTTALSSLKKNNPSVYARTALGHYSVAASETEIKITGFNLTGGTISFTNDNAGTYVNSTTNITVPFEAKSGSLIITQTSADNKTVQTLNNLNNDNSRGSYPTLVNLTDSTAADYEPTGNKTTYTHYYNRQPNNDNNNLLTDDVWFDIWEIDPTAALPFEGKGRIAQPIMKINPATDQLGFAFANSAGYFSMAGKTLEAAADSTAGKNAFKDNYVKTYNPLRSYSYTYWTGELNAFSSIGFAYDKAGNSYGTAAGGNLNVGQAKNVDFFFFTTDKWGKAYGDINTSNDFGRHKSSKTGINAIRLEKTGLATTSSGNLFDAKRIHSPSIVTAYHDDGDTSVYLAYYDAITDTIRYRAGNLDNTKTINDTYYEIASQTADNNIGIKFVLTTDATNEIGDCNVVKVYDSSKNEIAGPYMIYNYVRGSKQFNLVDSTGTKITTAISDAKYIKVESDNSKGNFGSIHDRWGDPSTDKYANVDKDNAESNYDYITILAGGSAPKKASDYFALGVIPGETYESDVVVAIWYSENTLWYAYNTTPTQNLQDNTTAAGWTTPIAVFKDTLANAGEYCQIAVDETGGVHIAALDSSQSDLIYAYLPSSFGGKATSTDNFKTCIVDSNGTVGDSLTIDVAFDKAPSSGGIAIPSISYYSSATKRPKVAYLVKKSNEAPAGAVSEEFTGNWECSVVPTTSTLDFSDTNRVNVGVWKDDNGILKETPSTGDKVQSKDYLVNYYYGVSYGIKFGNGTPNAILGYAVKKDSSTVTIETAQMR